MGAKYRNFLLIAALSFTDIVLGLILFYAVSERQESQDKQQDQHPYEIVYSIPDGQEARAMPWANDAGTCFITYYCPCSVCCGNPDGITYSGAKAVPYETCAVDPELIPLGSTVIVDYGDGMPHVYRAEDTGSGVNGNHIDIFVASHDEAKKLGKRAAYVYWLPVIFQEPEKPGIYSESKKNGMIT